MGGGPLMVLYRGGPLVVLYRGRDLENERHDTMMKWLNIEAKQGKSDSVLRSHVPGTIQKTALELKKTCWFLC